MKESSSHPQISSNFEEGIIHFGGARMILFDIEGGFLGIRGQIEAVLGEKLTNNILQQAGVNGGASFAASYAARSGCETCPDMFRGCLSAFQKAGFGRFEIEIFEWPIGRIVIRGENTFESWVALRRSSSGNEPVCAYTSGVLVGFINSISNRNDVVCVKHKCQGLGDDYCLYELLPADQAVGAPVISYIPDPALGRHINLLEMMFARMPMGIAIFNADACLERSNPTWEHMIERKPIDSVMNNSTGKTILELLPNTEAVLQPLIARVLTGEFVKTQELRIEVNGTSTYWDAAFSPLFDENEIIGFMVVVVDVSERVTTQRELEQAIKDRSREIATLMEISYNIAMTQELDSLLGILLDDLKSLVDFDGATILAIENNKFAVKAYRGPLTWDVASKIEFPIDDPLDTLVYKSNDYIIIADTTGDSPEAVAFRNSVGEEILTTYSHIRSWIGVPLQIKGEVIGHLAVEHHEIGFFTPPRVDLVLTFANQVAIVLENSRLQMEANRAAVLDERQRIARELHDSVSQSLYGISLGANTLQKLFLQEDIPDETLEKIRKPLEFIISMTGSGLDELRTLIFELHPDVLQKHGLVVALERQTEILKTRHHIEVVTDFCVEPDLSFPEKEALYRLTQEALSNIVKHANASVVQIQLEKDQENLSLIIQDDGIGFEPQIDRPGHLGLKSMRERMGKLGGLVRTLSSPGQGTRIVASLPLQE